MLTSSYYWHADTESLANYLETIASSVQLVVVEEQVYRAHQALLPTQKLFCYPGGESIKQFRVLEDIFHTWLTQGLHRKGGAIVAVGGGAFLDAIGFAAAIYHRGLPVIYVPTTLLAMVDAAVGGKTGINFAKYKNILGTFRMPEKVIFDLKFLQSLAPIHWAEGFAEIVKYACIADTHLFDSLKKHNLLYYQSHTQVLRDLIKKCVNIKEKIIASDRYEEAHTRVLLNFGHSFAHAMERVCEISHGEAVSYGMMFSTWLSVEAGNFSSQKHTQLTKLLRQYQLPVFRKAEPHTLFEAYIKDKKRQKNTWEEILLDNWGKPYRHCFEASALRNYIEKYMALPNQYFLA